MKSKEDTPSCKADELQCTIGCKSKKDAVVEEETNAGASNCSRASVNEWK